MITLDQDKVAAILAARRAKAAEPGSTHTIERVIERAVEVPQELPPVPSSSWSLRDAMIAVEDREQGDESASPALPIESAPRLGPDDVLTGAVKKALANVADNQHRYELALQARNGKAEAIALVELEANERGLTVAGMVQTIIDERAESERRTMLIFAAEHRWRLAIAEGGPIADHIAQTGAAEIAAIETGASGDAISL